MRIDGEAKLRIGCVCSDSERARAAFAEIEDRYQWADPDDCDVLVALGGDGFLLHVMHRHLELARPIFGMNRGTVGFLLDQFKAEGLVERIAAATRIDVHPLAMRAVTTAGQVVDALAFNEVAVTRDSGSGTDARMKRRASAIRSPAWSPSCKGIKPSCRRSMLSSTLASLRVRAKSSD